MLTAKQNLKECITGGNPDRVVNQFEAISLIPHPYLMSDTDIPRGTDHEETDLWGVTMCFPAHVPAAYPVHTPDKIVVRDIEHWRDYVHAPSLDFSDELWDSAKRKFGRVDGNLSYKAALVVKGLFERTHYLCSISEALIYYITNPDEMHDMIKYITEWELKLAEGICSNLHPDAVFHHDDWGTDRNSFMSPDMFAEFFLEPYQEIYRYYHEHGCELVIHHSDSYAANLVPYMIDMGIDIWQGCIDSNNIPELIEKYGGKISFMGGIDNKFVDFEGWTKADCANAAAHAIETCGSKYFIPCIAQGGPGSVYPGVYAELSSAIDEYNYEKFGFTPQQQAEKRVPTKIIYG